MSTTATGNKFRDEVASLLTTAGYTTTTEILEGPKRLDGIFEQTLFGKRRRYALEAKNWKTPLNLSNLETIYGGYASLLQTRRVNELLIVSPHEIQSPQAKAFLRETPNVTHQSFKELQESILGFHNYLATFVCNHEADGLEKYFVEPVLGNSEFLADHLFSWLDNDGANPLAIIASYGMGKTSFAHHIAYQLAKKFLGNVPARVPIIVSLGAISREQSLEGLIGSILAGTDPTVRNYSFPLFFRLNTLGRFVIFLDGFDEMKHMMTWSEFQANFDELNRLVNGKAKVLLLGRPTAFLSDDERSLVLRGTQKVGKSRFRPPNAPTYFELSLEPFSAEQVKHFIRSYLTHYKSSQEGGVDKTFLARREKELDALGEDSLISRPVHARMLADLATDPEFDITAMTRFTLYDHFFNHLVKREFQKEGRGSLHKPEDRRDFACDLAWYLWTTPSTSGIGCRLDDLPDELFKPYTPVDEQLPSVKRALLSGSLLDEKAGGVYFFVHRSFQEFLVAEYIWNSLGEKSDPAEFNQTLELTVEYLTQEVLDFLGERGDKQFFGTLLSLLNKRKQAIPVKFARLIATSEIARELAASRNPVAFSTWDSVVITAHAVTLTDDDLRRATRLVREKAGNKPGVLLTSIWLMLTIHLIDESDADEIAPSIIALLFADGDNLLRHLSTDPTGRRLDTFANLVFDTVSAEFDGENEDLIMSVDFEAILEESNLDLALVPEEILDETREPVKYTAPFDHFFREVPTALQRRLYDFYRHDAIAARSINLE